MKRRFARPPPGERIHVIRVPLLAWGASKTMLVPLNNPFPLHTEHMVMKILAVDLGKIKSVVSLRRGPGEAMLETIITQIAEVVYLLTSICIDTRRGYLQ